MSSSDFKIDYKILTLENNTERKEFVIETINKYPFFNKFIGCHWKYDWEEIKMFLQKHKIRVSFFKNKGKLGRWVSFLKYLVYLNETDFDYGVLVEDDTIIHDNFKKILLKEIKKQQPTDFLRLHNRRTNNILVIKKDCIDDFFILLREKTICTANDVFIATYTNLKITKIKVHRVLFKSNINKTEKINKIDKKILSNIQ